jgi:hypothetical protein
MRSIATECQHCNRIGTTVKGWYFQAEVIGGFQVGHKAMRINGYFETLSGALAKGWAATSDGASHRQVELEFLVDSVPVISAIADVFREDLRDAGIGDGFHAFEIDLSEYLNDLKSEARITIREKSSGKEIPTLGNVDFVYRPRSQRKTYTLAEILLSPPKVRQFSIEQGDKLAIYATYTTSGGFYDGHDAQIAALHAAGYKVIVSHVPGRKTRLRSDADVLLIKQNIGHDFGSWWAGLAYARERDAGFHKKLSSLLLLNDSCFGAVSAGTLAAMDALDTDVAGICDSYQVAHHLQSFCLLCGSDYLQSGDFTDMLLNYGFPESKADVIHEGEIALSTAITRSGANIRALHGYDDLAARWKGAMSAKITAIHEYYAALGFERTIADEEVKTYFHLLRRADAGFAFNPSHLFWQEIIEAGTLVVKKELLLKNPAGIPGPGPRLQALAARGIIEPAALNAFLATEKIAMRFA